jgi:hypothetical protein
MLFATVMLEYLSLSDRFISLEDVMTLAVDSALNESTGSEEMFSDKFQAQMSSRASGVGETAKNAYSSALVYNYKTGTFDNVNVYKLARYFEDNKDNSSSWNTIDVDAVNNEFSGDSGGDESKAIFEWVFGKAGSDYGKTEWADTNTTKEEEYSEMGVTSDRGMTEDFKNFFNSIGYKQYTVGYVKERKTTSTGTRYKLTLKAYPALFNMGFSDMSGVGGLSYTQANNSDKIVSDNFTSSCHVGKSYRAENNKSGTTTYSFSQSNTLYYLTPASLGVTYVPTKVFKAAVISNINSYARLKSISGASTSDNNKVASKESFDLSTGCIPTQIYEDNGKTQVEHKSEGSIVNDGNVEYDLSTVKVKVDYFFIDFGSNSSNNATIISRLTGQLAASTNESGEYTGDTIDKPGAALKQVDLRTRTLVQFKNNDTAGNVSSGYSGSSDYWDLYKDYAYKRIVAKVSVKVKVHIPYQSAIIQWACKRFQTDPSHYSVKLYDAKTGKMSEEDDGTWYQYTTYFMQSRS